MSTAKIVLTPEEHAELSRRVRSATISQRDGRRARVILLASQGCTRAEISRLTGLSLPIITGWCQRFQVQRLDGLVDKPGRGRKPSLPLETVSVSLNKSPSSASASLDGAVAAWPERQGFRPPACIKSGRPMT